MTYPEAGTQNQVKLIYVQQLKTRRPAPDAKPRNFAGTHPASVTAVQATIGNERGAFTFVRDTGVWTFEANLSSHPVGARISYKKLIDDDYKDLSGLTDVQRVSFELATLWTFKFHKDGCTDEPVREINPYGELHPSSTQQSLEPLDVDVEFQKCRHR